MSVLLAKSKADLMKQTAYKDDLQRSSSHFHRNYHSKPIHPIVTKPEGLGVPVQEFWINPRVDNLLEGIGGISIFIPRQTFLVSARELRKSGADDSQQGEHIGVKITLKEVYEKSEAVQERLSTVTTDGQVLESGGMLYLNAQNKRQQQLRARRAMTVRMPSRQNRLLASMQVYQSRLSGNSTLWELDERTQLQKDVTQNSETVSYAFQTTQLEWINCDRISQELRRAKRTQIKVFEPAAPHTSIIPIIHDRFSVLLPAVPVRDMYQISKAPLGAALTVVGIKTDEGQSFLAMQNCVVEENLELSLDFEPMTKDEIQEALKQLNDT